MTAMMSLHCAIDYDIPTSSITDKCVYIYLYKYIYVQLFDTD